MCHTLENYYCWHEHLTANASYPLTGTAPCANLRIVAAPLGRTSSESGMSHTCLLDDKTPLKKDHSARFSRNHVTIT